MILGAAGLLLVSGLPACFGSRFSNSGQRLSCALLLLGSGVGWVGLVLALLTPVLAPGYPLLTLPGALPGVGFSVELDALSAVFLVPVFTVPALCAVFGLRFWRQTEHPDNGRGLGLFFGVLAGAMVMVVIARDAVLFLIAWETMALSAYFLAVTESDKPEVRRDGWVYLVASHVGAACLLALFALMCKATGGFTLAAIAPDSLDVGMTTALFLLAVLGFGIKVGIMPLSVWLPAHAGAPSHVSAMMSGVMLKMGIYGLLRILMLLPAGDMWHSELLMGLGAMTGVLGIAFAMGQRDIRLLLAYSSIENIGIIIMGIGLALMGRTLQRDELVALGLAGALLHVWNHSLFKPLLFLNSGVILRATSTVDMNRMGGLARKMPYTAGLFLFGSVAICGLPPLNGFVSEWLLYMGLFGSGLPAQSTPLAAAGIGAVALALIGALALACFVKLFCCVFLGQPRHAYNAVVCDPHPLMCYPMFLLAGGCLLLGVLPQVGMPLIQRAVVLWMGSAASLQTALPLVIPASVQSISVLSFLFMLVAGGAVASLRIRLRRLPAAAPVCTWGCGYARPTPRMQYTAVSFAQVLVQLFAWALRPSMRRPVVTAYFPSVKRFAIHVKDPVLTQVVLPGFRYAAHQMMKLRLIQQGRTHIYLLYILMTMLFLLCWERFGFGQ